MKIWLNGEIVPPERACLCVYDHGMLYGDGVFEGIRVYNGRVFQNRAHLDRLFDSARHIRLAVPYTKQELAEAMEQLIEADDRQEGYIRLAVTRGAGTLGLSPFKCPTPNVFIIVDDIALYPEEMYRNGMSVVVADTVRTSPRMLNPRVKSLNYLNNIMAKIEAIDAGVPEALMLNESGEVAEATGDNIFTVKDGTLMTPPAEAGILLGITRAVVMHLASKLDIPTVEQAMTLDQLYEVDECFLTGTAAEVIAVTRVDERTIGDGAVGPVTLQLLQAFRGFIITDEEVPYP